MPLQSLTLTSSHGNSFGRGGILPPPKNPPSDSTNLTTCVQIPTPDTTGVQVNSNTAQNDTKDSKTALDAQPKVSSATCIPIATYRIQIDLPRHRINGHIRYKKDHALINKFLGLWPTEKGFRDGSLQNGSPKDMLPCSWVQKDSSRPYSTVWRTETIFFTEAHIFSIQWAYILETRLKDSTWTRKTLTGHQFGSACIIYPWNTEMRKPSKILEMD